MQPLTTAEMFPRSKKIESELKTRISKKGKITFKEFMEVVLYLPEFGYYTNPDREPWRDFFTSPDIHPVFSRMMAKQLADMYACLGSPKRFLAVEMGAGKGLMAFEILRYSKTRYPAFHKALTYVIIEPNALNESRQRSLFAEHDLGVVLWFQALERLPFTEMEGCILSNELLDSYPVNRVTMSGGKFSEIYVAVERDRFVERLGTPSTVKLQRYFEELGFFPSRGTVAEVNLNSLQWIRTVASIIKRGFVLTIDYGLEARRLFARSAGTFLCYHNHAVTFNPYIRLGYQDMTSHVDFTSLSRAGEKNKLRTLALITQAEFLRNLGIDETLQSVQISSSEHRKLLRAIRELTNPRGLGGHKVLIQSKNIANPRLACLAESRKQSHSIV
ncbi:MAG: class I SAM-dependent methyltransferase [Candidatus Bathyarchaeia archaeon]